MLLDAIDRRIIAFLQGDIPLEPRPFAGLAQRLGLSESEVVERVAALADNRVMRRFGATLRHQKSGFDANVMVAWRAPLDRVTEIGGRLSDYRRVSHCYWRRPCPEFDYNLYSMVHGRSREECRELVTRMAREVGLDDYQMLFSEQELKKTSMRYFNTEGGVDGDR